MTLIRCDNGLYLPKGFADEKEFLKENMNKIIEETISDNQNIRGRYFIVFHGKFDKLVFDALKMCTTVSLNLPRFITNQIVFYVDNGRGLAEWLWTVSAQRKVEFNQKGVAFLQAKGAMPSRAESLAK